MNRYLKEVIDLHVLIEVLFARGEGSVAAMVERFHADFSISFFSFASGLLGDSSWRGWWLGH